MAGFFLGSGGGSGHHQRGEQQGGGGIPPTESFFLYAGRGGRGEEVGYTRGFELWQHGHQIQREHPLYATAGFADEPPSLEPRPGRPILGAGGSGGGGISCQDCGNQAKKDCPHLRCRTCCKSRGYQCSTHVKSTWVPAAKRRERQQQQQQQLSSAVAGEGCSKGGMAEPSKRPREIVTASTAIATTSTTYGGSLEGEGFPPEVSAPALFRCVRVSHVDEADDVYAYQAAVSIGGHLFKGLLYDHGPEEAYPSSSSSRYQLPHGEGSSSPAAGVAATTNAVAAAVTPAAAELLEPYATPLSAFMAGTQFFPQQHRP